MHGLAARTIILACGLALAAPVMAQGKVEVASGVSYEQIGRWDVARLNQILAQDMPRFAGLKVSYSPATNPVILYRVTYSSVIPEKANQPIVATGLLALPEGAQGALPLISYQHGTVYGKTQVPSVPDNSEETAAMIAQFAGQGYALIGADYFGMGGSAASPEGYMVKGSHQQATQDMLTAARAVMAHLKTRDSKLFLAGWSQGGFVTMSMLERLEKTGVTVDAAATASAPLDLFAAVNGMLFFPRKIDAPWTNSILILSAFAFEQYYDVPGMARALFAPEHYAIAEKAYRREPIDPTKIPTDLKQLLAPEYRDPEYFAASVYGRLFGATHAYRWVIQTPTRNYYGEADEGIAVGVGRMAMDYQHAMGAGNMKVEAISTGQTTHRGTFAKAMAEWKNWFDSMGK